jgi:hypothetical protein
VAVEEEEVTTYLRSLVNDRRFCVGSFATVAVKDIPTFPSASGFSFNIVFGDGERTRDFKKVDVGALQADPANKGEATRLEF